MSRTFLDIIRWKKLLYIVVIQFLFKICFLYNQGFSTRLSFFQFFLLSLSTICVLATGYLLSYSVRKKTHKYLKFGAKRALKGAVLTGVLGVFFCVVISFSIGKPQYSLIAVISVLIVSVYSYYITQKTFFTNLINSFIKVLSILIIWWFDTPINSNELQWEIYFRFELITVFYMSLSFVGNIVRETVKDIVNINQDYECNYRTIPILLGRRRAKYIALIISVLGCVAIFTVAVIFIKNKFILSTILFLGTFPQLYFIYSLMNAKSDKEYKRALKISDFAYGAAVASVPVVAYYFRYVIQ